MKENLLFDVQNADHSISWSVSTSELAPPHLTRSIAISHQPMTYCTQQTYLDKTSKEIANFDAFARPAD
jgi:hypothetical protein